MQDDPKLTPAHAGGDQLVDRLDSWKEIAAFLGRGIRTVQRWEREEGLPVHRLAHEKRGSIYAKRAELSAWWESRRLTLATAADPPAEVPARGASSRSAPERVTGTSALTSWPALSSDARFIAYVSDAGQDGMTPQIWTQQIGGAALQLTSGEREYSHLSFSPDDTHIVFTARDQGGSNVYEVPTLGGEPRLLQRGASRGRMSPDGRWLACVPRDAAGIWIAARGGAGFRTIASSIVDVACLTWSPDSRSLLVDARIDAVREPDFCIVPIDGSLPIETGVVQRYREATLFVVPLGAAWVEDSLIFSAAGPKGVNIYRQRIDPSTFQPTNAPEQLTAGGEAAWLPTAAAGRLAFFSSRADANLWSVPLDRSSGIASGPAERMTRGPQPLGYLTVTSDERTLAYFSFRVGTGDVFLRDLQTGSERTLGEGPEGARGYPAISPSGRLLAFGMRWPSGRTLRPIFIAELPSGNVRLLGEDCRGRPREWADERWLVIERFAQLNSIALIDTESGEQRELIQSGQRTITNPRLSPDRRWIAFDVSPAGGRASVFVAPFRRDALAESDWIEVDRAASHPFWSADGRCLYYTPIGTNPLIRSAIRARRFDVAAGRVEGESIGVYTSNELLMPAYLPGTGAIATHDRILLVLGDFRGDLWIMNLDA